MHKSGFLNKRFFLISLICFLITGAVASQTSLIQKTPLDLYEKGVRLYENHKYGSGLQTFKEFYNQSDNRLLKGNARYYIALCAMELFQDDTEEIFHEFLNNYPEHQKVNEAYYHLGRYFFRERKWRKTELYLAQSDALELSDNEKTEYYFMRAYANFEMNKLDEALSYFIHIRDIQTPRYNHANYYYAYISYVKGNYENAAGGFNRLSRAEQFDTIVPVYMMQTLVLLERYQAALAYGSIHVENPKVANKSKLNLLLAETHFELGNYIQAIEYYQNAIQMGEDLDEANYYRLGYIYIMNKNYHEAAKAFEKIQIQQDSVGQNVAYHLASSYLNTNDLVRSRNLFRMASELDHDTLLQQSALLNYAKVTYQLNFQRASIEALRSLLNKYPDSEYADEAKVLISVILLGSRNYREAIEILKEIKTPSAEVKSTYQKLTFHYGLELYQNKQYTEAIKNFSESLKNKIDRQYEALSHYWLAESYYYNGNYSEAAKHFNQFLGNPASSESTYHIYAYYNLAYSYFKLRDYTNANRNFRLFITHAGEREKQKRADALARIGDGFFARNSYQDASRNYTNVIALNSGSVDYALYQMGIIHGLTGNDQKKIQTLQKIIENHPASPYTDDALFEIADAHLLLGNFDAALRGFGYLKQDFASSPYYRLALLKTGLIRYRTGDEEKSISTFKNIVELYPNSPEAKEAVNALRNIYVERGEEDKLFAFLEKQPGLKTTVSFQDSTTYETAYNSFQNANYSRAVTAFKRYLESFPKGYFLLDANYYLGVSALRSNDTILAVKHLGFVVDKMPNPYTEPALLSLSGIFMMQKDYRQAKNAFERLQKAASRPQNVNKAILGKMETAFLLNEYHLVTIAFNELSQRSSVSNNELTIANYYMGRSLFELQDYNSAMSNFDFVLIQSKSEIAASSLYYLAEIHFVNREFGIAKNYIYRLRDEFIFYEYYVAKGFLLLGDIFFEEGDYFQARHTYLSVKENYKGEDLKILAGQKIQKVNEKENE